MNRRIISAGLAVIFILIGGYFYFAYSAVHSRGPLPARITFEVKEGERVRTIAKNLESSGAVRRKAYFIFYVWKKNVFGEIMPGTYEFYPGVSVPEIVTILRGGDERYQQVKITFPEGWTREEMAARLDKNGFSKESFLEKTENYEWAKNDYFFLQSSELDTLEGFLFPDTYFFFRDDDIETIIRKMLDNFNRRLALSLREEIARREKTVAEIVTMASIIEKEVRSQEDRNLVSGVFWKRLENGQLLQSDTSLTFALGEKKRQYSYNDTRVDSPYNTYLYPGLPPGPIANPGLSAIEAAIYPQGSDHFFFLSDPDTGETVFSRTAEEHNRNKALHGL